MSKNRLMRIDRQMADEIEGIIKNLMDREGVKITSTEASKLFYNRLKNRKFEI